MDNVSEQDLLKSGSEGIAWIYYLRSTPNIAVHVMSVMIYMKRRD